MLFLPEPGVHSESRQLCQSLLIDQDCNGTLKWFGLQALVQLLYSRDNETETQVMECIAQVTHSFSFLASYFFSCLDGTSEQDLPKSCETLFFGRIALEKLAESWSMAYKGGWSELVLNRGLFSLLFEQTTYIKQKLQGYNHPLPLGFLKDQRENKILNAN